jgi:hypothetical protein
LTVADILTAKFYPSGAHPQNQGSRKRLRQNLDTTKVFQPNGVSNCIISCLAFIRAQ